MHPAPRHGFTLIELLTVIAIIGILAAIIIPVVGKVRSSARQTQCVSNIRQCALAVISYANENRGLTPSAQNNPDDQGGSTWQWQRVIYPYLTGNQPLSWPAGLANTAFHCPSGSPETTTAAAPNINNYSYGFNQYLPPRTLTPTTNERKNLTLIATPSRTMLLMDFDQVTVDLTATPRIDATARRHTDRFNIAYADGSAATMSKSAFDAIVAGPWHGVDAGRTLFQGR